MLVKQENGVIVSVNRKQIRDAKFAAKGKGSHSRGNFVPKQLCSRVEPDCQINGRCVKELSASPCRYRVNASAHPEINTKKV